jgi:hypothetical protein
MTQLYTRTGTQYKEIALSYRPSVSYVSAGTENGKTVNTIRIYIINLNSSEDIALYGKMPLKISCISTQTTSFTYDCAYEPKTVTLTALLNGATSQVAVPISSTTEGAIIYLDIVVCNIKVERCQN